MQSDMAKLGSSKETPKDQQIAALEDALQFEKDARLEERFLWVLAVCFIIDAALFINMQNIAAPLILFFIQLIFLGVVAVRLGIDHVAVWIDMAISKLTDKIKP